MTWNGIAGFFAFITWCSVVSPADQSDLPKDVDALVVKGVDLTLRQEYARADSVFQVVVTSYPQHPVGYLYRAAVVQAKSIDYLDPVDFTVFDSLLEQGK